jgi:hypothetical protein
MPHHVCESTKSRECSLFAAVLSAEQTRLWRVVTTNSLGFNAWTALIDETERF